MGRPLPAWERFYARSWIWTSENCILLGTWVNRVNKGQPKGRCEMPRPFRQLPIVQQIRWCESVVVGPVLVVGSVLVGLLADDLVVAIQMHLHLSAVLALDLHLEAAGAAIVLSLDLGDGSAPHRRDRGALGLLGVGAGELLLGVAAGSVGDPGAAEGHQDRDRCSYHQRPYV